MKAAQRRQPAAAAGRQREPLHALPPRQMQMLRRARQLMAAGERLLAEQLLLDLARLAPAHPDVLRWRGMRHAARGEWAEAAACLADAAAHGAGDFTLLLALSQAQNNAGDFALAPATLEAARACAVGAEQWLSLSLEFDRQGRIDDAMCAARRVLHLEPHSPPALLQRARCSKALGDAAAAAADCRTLIARQQQSARAWFTLVDLKTVKLSDDELAQLQRAADAPALTSTDRTLLAFALGNALEDAGRHAQALVMLGAANAQARRLERWDGAAFAAQVAAVREAFAATRDDVAACEQGGEVIFLVGLPRSGTTLVEQVLASHSQVEGASELPYLRIVIDAESERRGQAFPAWVPAASRDDWLRLGRHYLALSARWRSRRPVATDKLPHNWLLAGAALRMLPAARVVDCRRDALETCWSCYKQLFGPGQAAYSYDFATLAGYWHAYDGLARLWAARFPGRFVVQQHEALVAEPDREIRRLLQACGLRFEAGCLNFQRALRAIRTPSALQVREPLRRSSPAAGYGSLLEPLRQLLQTAPQAPSLLQAPAPEQGPQGAIRGPA